MNTVPKTKRGAAPLSRRRRRRGDGRILIICLCGLLAAGLAAIATLMTLDLDAVTQLGRR